MQLYVSDFVGDTLALSTEQIGAYMLLLMAMWNAGGALPDDDAKLARVVRMSTKKWRAISADLLTFFERGKGEISHNRLTKELRKSLIKSEARAAAGSRGGAATALKTKAQEAANADALPRHLPESRNHSEKAGAFSPGENAKRFSRENAKRFSQRQPSENAQRFSEQANQHAKRFSGPSGKSPPASPATLHRPENRPAGISRKPMPTPPTPSSRRSRAMTATELQQATKALAAMFSCFPQSALADVEMQMRGYLAAVQDAELADLTSAIQRFVRGEVKACNAQFCPSSAQLCIELRERRAIRELLARRAASQVLRSA
ncbi:DUF1376 domain-containing protein [Mesorhizobium sp. INR15]|uniref:YdaU family protein n=1 Tax=Mesorhizobium sp. INR15 TaxID=2654248 RepID=UPI0021565258|nr:DUF1376 domain-containing protein [Mesorhizobium sp. INR15]